VAVAQRPQVGDVFTIACDERHVGVGQVVAKYGNDAYFFAVFEKVLNAKEVQECLYEALESDIRFLALSLDAKIYVGDWPIIGSADVRADLPLPAYQEAVESGDHVDVVDYSGTRRRRASRHEVKQLDTRKIVAPVRLERALRADLGLEPWVAAFDALRPHGMSTRQAFA